MSIEIEISRRLGKSFALDLAFRTGGGPLGILGASGCGKSMTLKCIAGIETPDRGRIVVNGRVLFDSERRINVKPQQRRVGYLFQNFALFPRMTIEQNIAIAARAADKPAAVAALLERFQLGGLGKRFPDQLSGGQQQRAAIARMLAAEPEIILLDEPFSALDAHLREHMQLQLREMLADFKDVVMVTHNRDEAYKLCDELLILEDGRVLGGGPVRRVFEDPQVLEIARITGCKNFSRITRIGERELYARDWDLRLTTARPIPESTNYVGIRAHDFVPVYEPDPSLDNLVAMAVRQRSEDPFEWNVIFTNARASGPEGGGEIWWKYSKYLLSDPPGWLRLPPEALLLLHDGGSCGVKSDKLEPATGRSSVSEVFTNIIL